MRLNEDKKCIELTIHSLSKHMCPVEDGFPKHVPIQKKKKKHKKEDCGNNQERIITKNSILN
jgi:hypothetical protein